MMFFLADDWLVEDGAVPVATATCIMVMSGYVYMLGSWK